jgi:hypothetical protein
MQIKVCRLGSTSAISAGKDQGWLNVAGVAGSGPTNVVQVGNSGKMVLPTANSAGSIWKRQGYEK